MNVQYFLLFQIHFENFYILVFLLWSYCLNLQNFNWRSPNCLMALLFSSLNLVLINLSFSVFSYFIQLFVNLFLSFILLQNLFYPLSFLCLNLFFLSYLQFIVHYLLLILSLYYSFQFFFWSLLILDLQMQYLSYFTLYFLALSFFILLIKENFRN